MSDARRSASALCARLAALCLVFGLAGAPLAQAQLQPGGSQEEGCWQFSRTAEGLAFCSQQGAGASLLCIEWESNGVVTSTSCCVAFTLGSVGCFGSCLRGDRPLITVGRPFVAPPDAMLKSRVSKPLEEAARAVRPKLPVRFGDRVLVGDDLAELDGLDVHYLFVLDDGTGESALYALTDRQELLRAVRELDRSADESVRLRQETEAPGGVSLFADEMAGHASYFLAEGTGVDFSSGWWKDRISSLRGAGAPTWVTLYSGGTLSGSSLTFSTAWDRPTFEAFDWNDRTRSAYVWDRAALRDGDTAAEARGAKER